MSNSTTTDRSEWRRAIARSGAWLFGFLATLALPAMAAATEVSVRRATMVLDGGVYELDVQIDLSLPRDARRAIDAGVSLRLNYETEIARVRRYRPDAGIASLLQTFELSYHALSQRYLVRNLNTGEQFDHGSIEAALERMTEVRGLPLIDASLLESGPTYEFRVRAEVDMRTAPDALSWLLFWTDDWSATSEWYTWTQER